MNRPPSDEQGFIVRLEEFSGPLDLLLHLIREQEIEITDIPIAKVAEQFVGAIQSLGLNQAAEYLEMSARLLRIKILMLLPRPIDESGWDDPRAELVRRLLEYEQVREVVDWLADRARLRADRFPRGWEQSLPEQPPRPLVIDLHQVLAAADRVIASLPQPILHRVVGRPLDVEGATDRITKLLTERDTFAFHELFGTNPSIADVISALIAILELARVGRLRLAQPEPFGNVGVTREPVDQAA